MQAYTDRRLSMLKDYESIKECVYRRLAFTYNNYTEEGIQQLHDFATRLCLYLTYCKEVCPTTGTPHLQGFFIVMKNVHLIHIRKNLPNKIWIKPAYASTRQNISYCHKYNNGLTIIQNPNFNIELYQDWEDSPWHTMWVMNIDEPFTNEEWDIFNKYPEPTLLLNSEVDD